MQKNNKVWHIQWKKVNRNCLRKPRYWIFLDKDFKSAIINILNELKETMSKERKEGTSLVVQWLRIRFPMQGTWVRSLVGELRSHMLRGN